MRAHLVRPVLLAALVSIGISACAFVAPVTTLNTRNLSDGTDATIGAVDVRNAVLLTDDGTQASLLINLLNTADHAITVEVQYQTADNTKIDTRIALSPRKTRSFGGTGAPQFVLHRIDATPGGMFPVFIQYGDVTGQQLMVPVLTNALGYYSSLLPKPTPTPTPTPAPPSSPAPASSGAPSPSPSTAPSPAPGG